MGRLRLCAFLLLSLTCFIESLHAQHEAVTASPKTRAPATCIEVSEQRLALTIPLPQQNRQMPATMQVTLVDPEDVAWAQVRNNVVLHAGQKHIIAVLPRPFHGLPVEDLKDLHWMRLKYELRAESGDILATGIEALRSAATDPFVLTAAAARVTASGRPYQVRVHVQSGDRKPLRRIPVNAEITWEGMRETEHLTSKARTDSSGNATLEFTIPNNLAVQDGELHVGARVGVVERSLEQDIEFAAASYLLVDSDKDIYQPGQTLHARALYFDSGRKAVEKAILDVRIRDEEETLVSRQSVTTNEFGVAPFDWVIPTNARQGSYQLTVSAQREEDSERGRQSVKSVRVYRYDLPNFRVTAKGDQPYYLPTQNAEVTVSAEYLFGQPVKRGKVRIVEEKERNWNFRKQKWEADEGQVYAGELNRDGIFTARFDLAEKHKDLEDRGRYRDIRIAAYVTDLTTGRTEQRRTTLRITRDPIHVYLVSAQGTAAPLPQSYYVSTFYADGTPARCKVKLSLVNENNHSAVKQQLPTIETNKYGLGKASGLKLDIDDEHDTLLAEARDAQGKKGTAQETIYSYDQNFIQISGTRTIYKAGDPIDVTLRSVQPVTHVVVQAVRDGSVLVSQNVSLGKGQFSVSFPYDPRFTDEVTVFAYSLDRDSDDYRWLMGSRTVLYPKKRQLGIDLKLDKDEYRPGEEGVARISVHLPDHTGSESALGIKVVDQAVEERTRTDEEFGSAWGSWRWSLWSTIFDAEFSGVTRDDLDQLDLTEPIPQDLDLVAEYLLQNTYGASPEIESDDSRTSGSQAFSKFFDKQVKPIVTFLDSRNEEGKLPLSMKQVLEAALQNGLDLNSLRDPWGTPYRYLANTRASNFVVSLESAGPDKTFDTADDFRARDIREEYFTYYGESIQRASDSLFEKEGRFIRDRNTLDVELSKYGVDFEALRDPWGKPYVTQFEVSGSSFISRVLSVGEVNEKGKPLETVVWTGSVNYFAQSREKIEQILSLYVSRTGKYPADETAFREMLSNQGVDFDQLRDPWGSPFYVLIRKQREYGDRIRIQQREASSGSRTSEPVILVRKQVAVFSPGRDLQQGTADDAQVASYSILVADQGAQDSRPRPNAAAISLNESMGAILGVVADEMGAVISNASVDAVRELTAEKFSTKTDVLGNFQLRNLPPGTYQLQASAQGFRTARLGSVPVQASNLTEVHFELSVGGRTETVNVEAAPVQLETMNSSVVAARNFSCLVKLAPGIASANPALMSTPRLRQDFPETMLWEPALITDQRGHARLNFKFADNITTWRLTAVASTKNGELGHVEKDLRAFQPFFLEHDPPRVLTEGDEIEYPVVLRNYLDRAQTLKAVMKPENWFTLTSPPEVPVHVEAGDASRALFHYRTSASVSAGKQQVSVANQSVSDAVQKTIAVHPFGRPDTQTASSVIDKTGLLTLQVPENAIPGSVRAHAKIYPNLLAHVVENLEAGLERPHGCGEQTISSTYPSVLLSEIYANEKDKPPVARKAQRYVVAGYERLLAYQRTTGGFSYWGTRDEADISLTAYALDFLSRASNLIEVDPAVAEHAEVWLIQQQRDDGSWHLRWDRDDKDALLATAYVAQTLTQLSDADTERTKARKAALEKSLHFLAAHRDLLDEPYVVASYGLAAKAAGDIQTANQLSNWLQKNIHFEGQGAYWSLERNTPFYGWGKTGRLESTAMVMRALAAISGDDTKKLQRQGLISLLRDTDREGMWYSGQTTVQVLKTMLSIASPAQDQAGELKIRVNGKEAKSLLWPPGRTVVPPIELDVTGLIAAGENRIELDSSGGSLFDAQFVLEAYVPWQDASIVNAETNSTSTLSFNVTYSKPSATTDDKIHARIHAERVGHRGYGMMLGEVGLPPGADVDRESLERALASENTVSRYEVQPDRVIFYMWPIAGGSDFTFEFRPRFAMRAETAPSVLYDYYNPDASVTLKPTRFEVTAGTQLPFPASDP